MQLWEVLPLPILQLVPPACPETGLKESVHRTEEAENRFFFSLELFLYQFSLLNWIRGNSEEHECWREKEDTWKEKTGEDISVATTH